MAVHKITHTGGCAVTLLHSSSDYVLTSVFGMGSTAEQKVAVMSTNSIWAVRHRSHMISSE